MGVAPSVFWGRRRREVHREGTTLHDPDWLEVDYALIVLLDEYEATLCAGCGKPFSSHKGKTVEDYAAGFTTCPAIEALDIEQASRAQSDGNKTVKPDPSRPRSWFTGTVTELEQMAAAEAAKDETNND